MNTRPFVERQIVIRARRSTVFRFFQDSALFAKWWGAGSSIEGRAGGHYQIRYPNGVGVSGEVLELVDGVRVVLSYGYDDPGKPIPPGGSRVVFTFADHRDGTLLALRHELETEALRDEHVQGWRYQLALFANVAAAEQHRDAAATIDGYFALWAEPDAVARRRALEAVCAPGIAFRDAFGCTDGIDELAAQVQAAQIYMPGVRLERAGDVRTCQGTALVDWKAVDPKGTPLGRGTNVFELEADGRLRRVVGYWIG
jgi:uncharacterized protein YndB with AHSA1/START domain